MDDNKLNLPIAPGTSISDLIRRVGAISESGTVALMPGWDWEVIMCGLEGAISRYRSGLGSSKGIASRAAVGEALWWIAAADEFLRKRIATGLKTTDFYAEITKTSAGKRLAGLVFLRNRAGHQFAAALMQVVARGTAAFNVEIADGEMRPVTVTVDQYGHIKPFAESPENGYFFASIDLLPLPDKKFKEELGRDKCYDDLVAKSRVLDTLEAVHRSLKDAISVQITEQGIHFEFGALRTLPA